MFTVTATAGSLAQSKKIQFHIQVEQYRCGATGSEAPALTDAFCVVFGVSGTR